ncbi:MAG: 50S ribosomal protein L3 [Bradymonadaceae bacterium]
MIKGLIGKKVGMTQVFDDEGNQIPVTVVDVDSNVVVQLKSQEGPDGYSALKLGFDRAHKLEKEGEEDEWRLSDPEVGVFESAGIEVPRRHLREIRVREADLERFEVGEELGADLFGEGEWVDVTGKSKGRGFSGVVRRHNFSGSPKTHGTHAYYRHGGSIGQSADPARVFPGLKMAGQEGNHQVTIQNLRVIRTLPEDDLLAIKGGIPGPKTGLVEVRTAKKKHHAA